MIVLHHLSYSRSTRILWLLEELKIGYQLVRYERDDRFKAPAALCDVHPLCKSPVIVDGDLVLGESSVILTYINERYGAGRFAPPAGSDAYYRHEEWLQYVESTAAFPIMTARVGIITEGLSERMGAFIAPTLASNLDHIQSTVRKHKYLICDELMLADIQMSYLAEVADKTGLLTQHQGIRDYMARLRSRAAYRKAVEIGGPMMPA